MSRPVQQATGCRDLLVDLEPGRSLLDLGGLWSDLNALLGRKVEVVTERGLDWLLCRRVLKEARPQIDAGEITAGRLADLVAVDLDDPSLHPRSDCTKSVVYAMSPRAVTDVWVHGRRVVGAGRLATVDQDALLARVRELTRGWRI